MFGNCILIYTSNLHIYDMSNNVPLFVIGLPKHETKRQRESIRKKGAN
jgi:hypothetical protein